MRALKGRRKGCFALLGLEESLAVEPRALPWATFARIAESLRFEQASKAKLRGLGYGG